MQVLAILAQKGGVGKSMLARSLAVQGLLDGVRAAILDADPQGTVVAWSRRRHEHNANGEGTATTGKKTAKA